ncbi:ChaN family lipoprotein [Sulfurimonas sp. HSL-3221]|uniref:ChaN family lipoprotein n=1 Tax=Thiomicrolovo sulfuroxydans TaxID=2894755 RepID=UPI001E5BF985|nr:ChaN family lipoprotein [Sulfurimonas sp. HSL-3221]UFS63340.1 ChaN family lipoprotein [Sulfurimonas sp. HSL-3221]
MQYFRALFLAVFFILFSGCSHPQATLQHTLPKPCGVYDMKQAACIGDAELTARLSPYRVLFVGDHHASEAMHRRFAGVLSRLGENGRRLLLANEWFTPEDDDLLSRYARGTYDGNFTAEIGWKTKAGYPFSLYEPIYKSIVEAGGTLYGINMDKPFQKAVSDGNLSAMSEDEQAFFKHLDLNLSAHKAMLAPFFAHCHAKQEGEDAQQCRERMYRVQVAWDSYMGEQSAGLAATRLQAPEDLLVVFAGAFHIAYGLGISARFARRSAEPYATILPVPAGSTEADVGEADYLLFYTPDAPPKETE